MIERKIIMKPKDKSVLLNSEKVRAILDGTMCEFRCVMKRQDILGGCMTKAGFLAGMPDHPDWGGEVICPPYEVGDILYVRETWQCVFETEYDSAAEGYSVNIRTLIPNFDSIPKTCVGLSKECSCDLMAERNKYYVYKASDICYSNPNNELRWRSSVNMPREAARVFLKVVDIRAERLQDITTDGISNEGIWLPGVLIPADAFASKWDASLPESKREKYAWSKNPWVWVVRFERYEKSEEDNAAAG